MQNRLVFVYPLTYTDGPLCRIVYAGIPFIVTYIPYVQGTLLHHAALVTNSGFLAFSPNPPLFFNERIPYLTSVLVRAFTYTPIPQHRNAWTYDQHAHRAHMVKVYYRQVRKYRIVCRIAYTYPHLTRNIRVTCRIRVRLMTMPDLISATETILHQRTVSC